MKNRKICCVIAAMLAAATLTGAAGRTDWSDRQLAVHELASMARALGLDEDNPIIVECSRIWWDEEAARKAAAVTAEDTQAGIVIPEAVVIPEDDVEALAAETAPAYTEQDLNILAKVIWGEARGCPWEHKCAVGCVVLNRVHDPRFPDTVYDVVAQPRQYSTAYLSGFDGVTDECYEAARAVLEGEYAIPEDVVWQAQFVQGRGVWWASYVDTGWWRSTTYFCY